MRVCVRVCVCLCLCVFMGCLIGGPCIIQSATAPEVCAEELAQACPDAVCWLLVGLRVLGVRGSACAHTCTTPTLPTRSYSSPVFRLPTEDLIHDLVSFHNTGPNQVGGRDGNKRWEEKGWPVATFATRCPQRRARGGGVQRSS